MGISHPAKSTMRAPSATWASYSGVLFANFIPSQKSLKIKRKDAKYAKEYE
jgi:hypothetical protein